MNRKEDKAEFTFKQKNETVSAFQTDFSLHLLVK